MITIKLNRIYLDYNATSPLAPSVKGWLAKGDLLWANPAAQHSSGKKTRARLDEVAQLLHGTFKISTSVHSLVFHSGATEGINSWVLGHALQEKILFAYSPLDHSCVRAQAERLKALGHETLELPVDQEGNLLLDKATELLKSSGAAKKLINWTWVHNELGTVWPLADAVKLKTATQAVVHVDAVQAPGKVADWNQLLPELDAYTFSGHKFGALKGIGFSFIAKTSPVKPLLLGGGQQDGARSGTENVMGAWSIKLALEDLALEFNPVMQGQAIQQLRTFMDAQLQGKGRRMAKGAQQLNLNTIMIVLDKFPSDMSLPLFDLAGLEVSAGSACASGTAKANPVLIALGEQKLARHGLRFSTSWKLDQEALVHLESRFSQVFEKIK